MGDGVERGGREGRHNAFQVGYVLAPLGRMLLQQEAAGLSIIEVHFSPNGGCTEAVAKEIAIAGTRLAAPPASPSRARLPARRPRSLPACRNRGDESNPTIQSAGAKPLDGLGSGHYVTQDGRRWSSAQNQRKNPGLVRKPGILLGIADDRRQREALIGHVGENRSAPVNTDKLDCHRFGTDPAAFPRRGGRARRYDHPQRRQHRA